MTQQEASEQEKFNAWWDLKGSNSVILRAQAWSAWLARAEAEQPQQEADTDDWVEITNPDHVIRKHDQLSDYGTQWYPPSDFTRAVGKTLAKCGFAKVRCRRRDLPKVEQAEQCAACDAPAEPGTAGCKDCNEYATAICSPEQTEQWPKYYTTIDSPSSDVAFVKRVDETSYSVVYKNGREYPGFLWSAKNQSRRKQLTKDEAMALLEPELHPQKTRVRLFATFGALHIRMPGEITEGIGREVKHDAEGFYVE